MTTVLVSGAGTSGPRGYGWLSGVGAPSSTIGLDGDFYLDTTNTGVYYGPKTGGVWGGSHPFGGGDLTAADASIVVGGSSGSPTVRTGTLDTIAGLHPAGADWSNNGHKITTVANGTNPGDVAAFGQIPSSLPPNGAAGGDLVGSSYPNPVVAKVNGTSVPSGPTAGTALTATSSTTATWSGTVSGPWVFNVAAYGAVGDGKFVVDGAMTATSAVLTSATASFTSGDVGKSIMVKGAAVTGVTTLVTTISGFTNSTTVTLAATASTTVTNALVLWGTDDTSHIQSAINAALSYAANHGSAKVFVPVGSGKFYAIAGPLVTGGSTLGNAQLTLGVPVVTTANKTILDIEGVANGSGLQHWQQLSPQLGGSTLVSFGVFASSGAQVTSINAGGNPSVIGGPAQPGGYGIAPGVFSNMLVTLRNLSVLTTHSADGFTYTAADFSGVAEANLENFAYGTTGSVAAGDYSTVSVFGTGLSVGVLMPANGNNDNNHIINLSCHGGYTYALFATEHTVIDRLCILYCWAALCLVGNYFSSVGSVHGVNVTQASIEACINIVYVVGGGSSGVGPFLYATISTETGAPVFSGNSTVAVNAALGTIVLTGLFTPTNVTVSHSTGLKIINGQSAYPITSVTTNYSVSVVDQTILVDATAGNVTVTLISAAWTPNTYTVKKTDSSGNTVTLATIGGETIDGASTQVISSQWGKVSVAPARVSSVWSWYTV